ncbi:MAG: hypothetical protein ACYC63_21245 [Armatimonadota bacterium]
MLVALHTAILSNAQEEDAVDDGLDGVVEFVDGEAVAQGEVAGEFISPAFDLLEELGVDGGGAALALATLGKASKKPLGMAS